MRPTISSLAVLLLASCSFGFSQGGFPKTIKTVAVSPFENDTPDPSLGQDVTLSIKQAMQSRLGLRAAPEQQADALVRGTVVRYDPDQPLAVVGTPTTPGVPNQVSVTRRQVELTVTIEVVDQKTGLVLWNGQNQVVQGDYDPGNEQAGRKKALDLLVKKVIDGVHSNW